MKEVKGEEMKERRDGGKKMEGEGGVEVDAVLQAPPNGAPCQGACTSPHCA